MKANRKFVNGEEAVSAVIGVILMVAITVAIAATVYVYVTGMMPSTTSTTPNISWSVDSANQQITITKGATGYYYGNTSNANLTFKDSTGTHYIGDGTFTVNGGTANKEIEAGDTISGFSSGTYTIIWEPTNTVIGSITFP